MRWLWSWWAAMLGLAMVLSGCGSNPTPTPTGPTQALKLVTTESGVYQISSADLASAGMRLEDPKLLHIRYRGRELPVWTVPGNQPGQFTLQFYAAANDASRYSASHVYWLVSGETNAQFNPISPADFQLKPVAAAPGAAQVTQRFEENKLYTPAPETGDHWFWFSLNAPGRQVIPFSLDVPFSGPTTFRIEVWSNTSGNTTPDHRLKASLNGQVILDESWKGMGERVLTASVAETIFKTGSNELVLELPGIAGTPAENTWLNRFEWSGPRLLQTQQGQLDFTMGSLPLTLTGFNGETWIYAVSDPFHPTRQSAIAGSGGGLQVQAASGQRLVAVDARGLKKARIEVPNLSPDLKTTTLQADWLVIGPPDLLEAARPLSEYRQKQGLAVLSVPLAAVFDQFGDGFPEPEAIQRFLQVTRNWAHPPRSVLLLGDASYDPIGYQAPPEANRLPTALVYTQYGGETGSDLPLADLDGDHRPDIAIGRIPARTPEQVKILIEKIMRFEAALQPAKTWRLLAVADGQEAQFAQQARDFLALFPENNTQNTYFPLAGAAQAATQVQQFFNQGVDLVTYIGHGSLNMWGKDRIFSSEDAAKLTNRERQPVLLQFTCLAGLFTHPKRDSLSETLLWLPNAGVVAALAPTSLTNGSDQEQLSRPLAQALADGQHPTLGSALLFAWREMPLKNNANLLDVLNTFVLLGDPELRIIP